MVVNSRVWFAFMAFLTTSFIMPAQGKTMIGHVRNSDSFKFLGRFAFASNRHGLGKPDKYVGHLRYNLSYPQEYRHNIKLLLFFNASAHSGWE